MDSEKQKNSEAELSRADPSQIEYLRGLAEIVRDENLSELEVETGGVRVTLRTTVSNESPYPTTYPVTASYPMTTGAVEIPTGPVVSSTPVAAASPAAPPDETLLEIVSPMIGVFYRAPSPADPNFVEIGDKIEVGQTVALVEAMKVFNEITAEVAGTIVDIKPESGDLVETGQVLITLRP